MQRFQNITIGVFNRKDSGSIGILDYMLYVEHSRLEVHYKKCFTILRYSVAENTGKFNYLGKKVW